LPNPNLNAEKSWSFELGANQILTENIFFDASVFWNEYDNLIEPKFVSLYTGQFLNVTKARIYGVDFSAKSSWFDNTLNLNFSYTYLYPKDLTLKDILRFRSRHLFYSSVSYLFNPFEFGVDFRYLSRIDRIDEEFAVLIKDGERRVPTYIVEVHLSSMFNLGDIPLRTVLQVSNLLQYHYVELIGNIAPIRSFTLTIESTF
jgi:outer membrane cobalamin receptor